MPTDQPSNTDAADAPEARGIDARDPDRVGAVLTDEDDTPGGGGLLGAGAGGALSADAQGKAGAATPNSPIDAALPHDAGDAGAAREAQVRSLDDAR